MRLRALQQVDSLLRVAGAHVEFTRNQQIVGAVGIGANHLQQQPLGIVGAAHARVGLRQPAQTVGIARSRLQPVLVGVHRRLVAPGQPRRVAQQKPELVVLRSGFDRALRVVGGGAGIAVPQRIFGGAGQSSNFDAAAPAHAVLAGRIGLRCRLVLLRLFCHWARRGCRRRLLAIDFKRLRHAGAIGSSREQTIRRTGFIFT